MDTEERSREEADLLARSTKRAKESEEGFSQSAGDVEMVLDSLPPQGFKDRDETMGDASLKADQGISFRDKLLGIQQKRNEVGVKWSSPELSGWGEDDVTVTLKDGWPSVSLKQSAREKLYKPWMDTLIVKLMGGNLSYTLLVDKLNKMWQPTGNMEIIDLGDNYFIVHFSVFEDYQWAIDGGPWMVFGKYLTVRKWVPGFRPENDIIDKTLVWVRLPRMPIEYYDEHLLVTIGNTLGRCVKIDERTLTASRGQFAKVCVEVELDKPLVPKIELDGIWQKVEYEGLPQICFQCGRAVHVGGKCPMSKDEPVAPVSMEGLERNGVNLGPGDLVPVINGKKEDNDGGDFGIWMHAPSRTAKKKSPEKKSMGKSSDKNPMPLNGGSRFNVLNMHGPNDEVEKGEIVMDSTQGNGLDAYSQPKVGQHDKPIKIHSSRAKGKTQVGSKENINPNPSIHEGETSTMQPPPMEEPPSRRVPSANGRGGRTGVRGGRFGSGIRHVQWAAAPNLDNTDISNFPSLGANPSSQHGVDKGRNRPNRMMMSRDGKRLEVPPDLIAAVRDPRLKEVASGLGTIPNEARAQLGFAGNQVNVGTGIHPQNST